MSNAVFIALVLFVGLIAQQVGALVPPQWVGGADVARVRGKQASSRNQAPSLQMNGLTDVSTGLLASGALSNQYHALVYFLAGGICCSVSHAVGIPVDVVKTRQQTSKKLAAMGPLEAMREIVAADGMGALMQGAAPTVAGFAVQGALKYGLYEMAKPTIASFIAASAMAPALADASLNTGAEASTAATLLDYVLSGLVAETVGSTTLAPFEAARIRMVTIPNYANGLGDAVQTVLATEGTRGLFLGLPAILLKHVPFTMVQLSSFELFTKYIYTKVLGVGAPLLSNPQIGSTLTGVDLGSTTVDTTFGETTITSVATAVVSMESLPYSTRFGVTLLGSVLAGLLGTIVSQPGDTLMSVVNKPRGTASGASDSCDPYNEVCLDGQQNSLALMRDAAQELGLKGLYSGLEARLAHVMVVVCSQLLIYDFIKHIIGRAFS